MMGDNARAAGAVTGWTLTRFMSMLHFLLFPKPPSVPPAVVSDSPHCVGAYAGVVEKRGGKKKERVKKKR